MMNMETVLRKLQEKIQSNLNLKKVGGGARFFGGTRRGESAELASDINSNDKEKQKNAVKRVIANMTLGRDVSQLFVDVVKLGQTLNMELKKLVYLYVLNTAKLQQDKALMAVNTFLLDATHQSPIVRALALRTMMCLRVECVTEYTLEPLRRAVNDPDPYVRKTAAIGIGKLFHQSAVLFNEQGFVHDLIRLLGDSFPIVSGNAAAVLSEINAFGSFPQPIRQEWANHFLNALAEASEWAQVYLLDAVAEYKTRTAEEAETAVARVLPRLSHTNSAVVLSAIKVIACQAPRCSHEAVSAFLSRANSALLTLVKGEPETQYIILKNIQVLLALFPSLLRENIDSFFIRFTDPPYVKLEKLRLILKLTNDSNAAVVVKELCEYNNEVDPLFVREVVSAVPVVAIKVPAVAAQCANLLTDILAKRPEMLAQVVTAAKNIVRKYPELLLLDTLLRDFGADGVADEEAKVSLVWMLGEFCDFVEQGPAVLQTFIESLLSQEVPVQLAILSAVVKVFLRNPRGMEGTLNAVLETLTTKSPNPDVRDRAYSYWRLLSKGIGVENMKRIVHGRKPPVDVNNTFSDAMTAQDMRLSINTASAMFGKPFRTFLPSYGIPSSGGNDDEEEEEDGEVPPVQDWNAVQQQGLGQQAAAAGPAVVPPAARPAQHVDPLEALFQPAAPLPQVPAAKQPATSPSSGGSTIDDIFGPAVVQQKTPVVNSAVLPPVVLDAGVTNGLTIRGQLVTSPTPQLHLHFTNVTASPVSEPILQVNTSSFGFVPSSAITDCMTGSSFLPGPQGTAVVVPLRVSDNHFVPSRHVVEVGVKTTLGLHRFTLTPAVADFFVAAPVMERSAFAQQWKLLDESCEGKMLLGAIANVMASLATDEVAARLTTAKFLIVASKIFDGQEAFYGVFKTHLGVPSMFEIVFHRQNRGMSYLCCKCARVNDVLPVAHHVLTLLFPAPKVAPSIADSLFF
jgi:AP-1 complex subunit beta-1